MFIGCGARSIPRFSRYKFQKVSWFILNNFLVKVTTSQPRYALGHPISLSNSLHISIQAPVTCTALSYPIKPLNQAPNYNSAISATLKALASQFIQLPFNSQLQLPTAIIKTWFFRNWILSRSHELIKTNYSYSRTKPLHISEGWVV